MVGEIRSGAHLQMQVHDPVPSFGTRGIALIAAGWLSVRGGFWIFSAVSSLDTALRWQSQLTDALLGVFCILLAVQLFFGTPGVRVPAVLLFLLHTSIQVHRWAILDASGWSALSISQRLQIIFDGGISALLAFLLIFCSCKTIAARSAIQHSSDP
jgi:hypothetical protein